MRRVQLPDSHSLNQSVFTCDLGCLKDYSTKVYSAHFCDLCAQLHSVVQLIRRVSGLGDGYAKATTIWRHIDATVDDDVDANADSIEKTKMPR